MNGYQSYETQLKALYSIGILVPQEIDKLIPSSNKSRWKGQDPTRHVGYEWCQTIEKHKEQLNLILENQHQKRSILILAKTNIFLIQEFIKSGYHYKVMKKNIEGVVNFVSYLKQYMNTTKACKLLGLKRGTFQSYLQRVKYKCFDSPILFCFKANPLQLSFKELSKIKELMTDDRFKHWSGISIYYYGIRNNIFHFSESTFYKYTSLLGLTKRWVREKRKMDGLKAVHPNEYWHADVSIWDNEGIRYYIYLVVDNYSRKVLSWKVNRKISAKLMFENLQNAYLRFKPKNKVKLLVDGGSENKIDLDIISHQLDIFKLVARKDITFSNSMVEAAFQTIKKYYFRVLLKSNPKVDPNIEMPWIVEDINSIRPNAQLKGLTPDEIFAFKFNNIPSYNPIRAVEKRRIENLNYSCVKCK